MKTAFSVVWSDIVKTCSKDIPFFEFENRSHIVIVMCHYINMIMRIIFILKVFWKGNNLIGKSVFMKIFSLAPVGGRLF